MSYIPLNAGSASGDHTGTDGRVVGLALISMLQELYAGVNAGKLFNVMAPAYGATGIGADDTAAIQAADIAASAAGGTVYFPPGIYGLALGGISRRGASWLGSGPYASIIKSLPVTYSVANTSMISCVSHNNWTVQDLGFDTTAAAYTIPAPGLAHFVGGIVGTLLTVTAVTDGTIAFNNTMQISGLNIRAAPNIISAGTGVGGTGTYNLDAAQTTPGGTAILAVPATPNFYFAFIVQGCSNWAVRNCIFTGLQPYDFGIHITALLAGSLHWAIEDCIFIMPAPSPLPNKAINISTAGTGGLTDDYIVRNNFFSGTGLFTNGSNGTVMGNRAVGVKYGAGVASGLQTSPRCYANHFINNSCINGAGVDANSVACCGIESLSPESLIVGNYCYNNSGSGIKVSGDHSVITGNISKNNGQVGVTETNTFAGIQVMTYASVIAGITGSNIVTTGNRCYDDQGTPTQDYGYLESNLTGAQTGNTMANNRFSGHLLGDYLLAGLVPAVSQANGAVLINPVAVASLPAAAAANNGARYFVTDANATTFASIVAGGGANKVPVYSDGTNWRIG